MIRAVIFDLDNTLTDFMTVKRAAVDAAVAAMLDAGLDARMGEARLEDLRTRVAAQIHDIYGREGLEYQKVFNAFLKEALGEVDYKLLAAAIVGYRRARDSALVTYPHVHLTLHRLMRRGLKLAVVSDAPREPAWLRLVYLNLHHVFDEVVTFEDTGVRKPESAPFEETLRRLDVGADEALMIGDWPDRDLAGARSVGIRTVFAKYGFSWSPDRTSIDTHPSDFVVHDILDLIDIVDRLNDVASSEGTPAHGR